MVKKIRIKNFKSLEDVEIEISQLNFLFGANSSGKSSFLKALMFLSKNLYRPLQKEITFNISKDLNLNDFKQTVFGFDLQREISYNVEFEGDFEFPTKSVFMNSDHYFMNMPFVDMLGSSHSRSNYTDQSIAKESVPYNIIYDIAFSQQGFKSLKIIETQMNCQFTVDTNLDFFPYSTKFRIAEDTEIVERFNGWWISKNPFEGLLNLNHVLSDYFNHEESFGKWYKVEDKWTDLSDFQKREYLYEFFKFAFLATEVVPNDLSNWLTPKYLGITREIPDSTYDYDIEKNKISLDHYYGILASLYNRSPKDRYEGYLNECKMNLFEFVKALAKDKTFQEKLEPLAKEYTLDLDSPSIFPMLVSNDGIKTDIVDFINYQLINFNFSMVFYSEIVSGRIVFRLLDINGNGLDFSSASSGLIQIFPVIASCGLVRENTRGRNTPHSSDDFGMLLIEQPELHLHPALQSKLADLFSGTAKCASGNIFVDFFIETHSEHLIRKIQVLIAKGELEREKVGVWYFKKVDGVTKVEKMEIDENGLFKKDWPDGFFDDSVDLTMELFEAIRKRKN